MSSVVQYSVQESVIQSVIDHADLTCDESLVKRIEAVFHSQSGHDPLELVIFFMNVEAQYKSGDITKTDVDTITHLMMVGDVGGAKAFFQNAITGRVEQIKMAASDDALIASLLNDQMRTERDAELASALAGEGAGQPPVPSQRDPRQQPRQTDRAVAAPSNDEIDLDSYAQLLALDDHCVKVHLSTEDINQLPTFAYHPKSSRENPSECPICLVDFEDGDKLMSLPCFHQFHAECIGKWLKEESKQCPTCREEIKL
jgi:hypothetical protein